uniref:Uncharacterized protein n=1 Tax=Anguilla anguilla TaxID=7936 RepID=A0A0E9R6U0_ANGAN
MIRAALPCNGPFVPPCDNPDSTAPLNSLADPNLSTAYS